MPATAHPTFDGMRKYPKTFEDILNQQYRWPKKGDRLLQPSGDWDTSAALENHPTARDAFIWDGFMTAGGALVDETEDRPFDRDQLIYPILFNYRHGLEMAMKWTIQHYGELADVAFDKRNHNLWSPWTRCKKIIVETRLPGDPDEPVRAVEQIVKDFHDIDKQSTAFRYSVDKNGCILELPTHRIDLKNLQEVMEGVNNFFQGSDGYLDNIMRNRWIMTTE